MAKPRNVRTVTLDDADLQKRNEALIIENEILKEELLDTNQYLKDLAQRVQTLYGVQTIGALTPDQVHTVGSHISPEVEQVAK